MRRLRPGRTTCRVCRPRRSRRSIRLRRRGSGRRRLSRTPPATAKSLQRRWDRCSRPTRCGRARFLPPASVRARRARPRRGSLPSGSSPNGSTRSGARTRRPAHTPRPCCRRGGGRGPAATHEGVLRRAGENPRRAPRPAEPERRSRHRRGPGGGLPCALIRYARRRTPGGPPCTRDR